MNTVLGRSVFLILRTQLYRKCAVIKLTTAAESYAPVCSSSLTGPGHRFCDSHVQLIGSDSNTNKLAVCNCTVYIMKLNFKRAIVQHVHRMCELIVVSTQAASFTHCSTTNRSRTKSSSTITDTTKTEDVKAKDTDMSQYIVGHDKDKKYFYIKLQEHTSDQQEVLAKLEYEWVGPDLVDLYHTEVPPQHQGRGIAKVLAKAAFDAFCEQDVLMRPTCTYLQKYLRENHIPRYIEHIEKDFLL